MKKLFIAIAALLILLSGCISVIPVTVTPPTTTPVASYEPEVSSEIGAPPSIPVVSAGTLSYENEHIDVDISYPVISGMLDEAMQQSINDNIYLYLKNMAIEMEQDAIQDPAAGMIYSIRSDFEVRRNDGVFLSISVFIDYYNGGANSGSEIKFINVKNSVPGQQLALRDLFVPGADYTTSINDAISAIIAADPDMSDYMFSGISDNQGFYLTDSLLVIMFERYTIAPGVMGSPEFIIPLSDLSGMLIPELG